MASHPVHVSTELKCMSLSSSLGLVIDIADSVDRLHGTSTRRWLLHIIMHSVCSTHTFEIVADGLVVSLGPIEPLPLPCMAVRGHATDPHRRHNHFGSANSCQIRICGSIILHANCWPSMYRSVDSSHMPFTYSPQTYRNYMVGPEM